MQDCWQSEHAILECARMFLLERLEEQPASAYLIKIHDLVLDKMTAHLQKAPEYCPENLCSGSLPVVCNCDCVPKKRCDGNHLGMG